MPQVIAVVGIASALAGTAVSMSGAKYQAEASANMYNYKAQVAEQNARYETTLGENKAQSEALKNRAQGGMIRAAQGAGNLNVNTGSAALVQQSEEKLGQFGEATVRSDAARRAYNFETESVMDTASAENAKTEGDYKMASSLLSGVGSVSDKWLQGNKAFGWGT